MSNVLDEEQQQQIRGLGRLGWSLRQIERATGIRQETIGPYSKAVGIPVRARGGRPVVWPPPNPATTPEVSTDPRPADPATSEAVSTDSATAEPSRAPSASACEPYRDEITKAFGLGRNAVAIYQDLVDDHGFQAHDDRLALPGSAGGIVRSFGVADRSFISAALFKGERCHPPATCP